MSLKADDDFSPGGYIPSALASNKKPTVMKRQVSFSEDTDDLFASGRPKTTSSIPSKSNEEANLMMRTMPNPSKNTDDWLSSNFGSKKNPEFNFDEISRPSTAPNRNLDSTKKEADTLEMNNFLKGPTSRHNLGEKPPAMPIPAVPKGLSFLDTPKSINATLNNKESVNSSFADSIENNINPLMFENGNGSKAKKDSDANEAGNDSWLNNLISNKSVKKNSVIYF